MSGNKKKKQCPYNEWVYCSDEDCECCGWYPEGRTKNKKKRKYTPAMKQKTDGEKRKKQKNNTSGYTGVNWNKNRQKWTAEIRQDGKRIYLGCFDSLNDAVRARKEAEEQLLKQDTK